MQISSISIIILILISSKTMISYMENLVCMYLREYGGGHSAQCGVCSSDLVLWGTKICRCGNLDKNRNNISIRSKHSKCNFMAFKYFAICHNYQLLPKKLKVL